MVIADNFKFDVKEKGFKKYCTELPLSKTLLHTNFDTLIPFITLTTTVIFTK